MARLNDDAQWIVLMGFIVSFSLFFLAIVHQPVYGSGTNNSGGSLWNSRNMISGECGK